MINDKGWWRYESVFVFFYKVRFGGFMIDLEKIIKVIKSDL